MNLDDYNLNKFEHKKNDKDNFLTGFMKDLQSVLSSFIKNAPTFNSSNLLEDSIYVVRDINDEKLSIINIENGKETDIYVASSKDKIEELHNSGISNNIYEMSKEDLYSLNLGSNLKIENGNCTPYYDEVKIENSEAVAKLEDMYFCLEQEKDAIYSVSDISDDKIYLTDTKEGGYFSIPKEAYPDFKVGDLVKNINGKYTLV